MLFCFVSFHSVHSVTFRCIYLSSSSSASLSLFVVLYNISSINLYVRTLYFIENDANWISRARENKRANRTNEKFHSRFKCGNPCIKTVKGKRMSVDDNAFICIHKKAHTHTHQVYTRNPVSIDDMYSISKFRLKLKIEFVSDSALLPFTKIKHTYPPKHSKIYKLNQLVFVYTNDDVCVFVKTRFVDKIN